jgi:transcriptional regulator with XRE-family HTH domain
MQQQVADLCGYKQGTVSRVFSGAYPAKSEVLCAIAEAVVCKIKIETLTSTEGGLKNEIMNEKIKSAIEMAEKSLIQSGEMGNFPTEEEGNIAVLEEAVAIIKSQK